MRFSHAPPEKRRYSNFDLLVTLGQTRGVVRKVTRSFVFKLVILE